MWTSLTCVCELDGHTHSHNTIELAHIPVTATKHVRRLLRNRVSAQQARERKKAYVTQLEDQVGCEPGGNWVIAGGCTS